MTKGLFEKIKEIENIVGENWLNEFQNAKTVQNIIEIANTYNIVISEEIAEEAFKLLNDEELSDEQLADIAGGVVIGPIIVPGKGG